MKQMWIERETHWKKEYDRKVDRYLGKDKSYLVANQLALGFDAGRLKRYTKRLVARLQRVIIHDFEWRDTLIKLQGKYIRASRAIGEYVNANPTAFMTAATDANNQLRKLSSKQADADNAIRNHIMLKGFTNQDIAAFLPDHSSGMQEIKLANQFIGIPIHIPQNDHNIAVLDGATRSLYALHENDDDDGRAATEYKSHELGLATGSDNYTDDYLFLRIPRHITIKELVSQINEADNARLNTLLGIPDNTRSYKVVPTFPILVYVEELMRSGLSEVEIAGLVSDRYKEPVSYGDINQRYKRSIKSLKQSKQI